MKSSALLSAGLAGAGLAALTAAFLLAIFAPSIPVPGDVALALIGLALTLACVFSLTRQARVAQRRVEQLAFQADRMSALLAAAPDPWCGWGSDGSRTASPGFAAGLGLPEIEHLDEIETALAPSDAAALHGSFQHLAQTGQPFRLTAATAIGNRALQISGSRAESADGSRFDLLWLRDVTAQSGEVRAQMEARAVVEQGLAEFRAAVDLLPFPVWLRRPDRSLFWCNRAYAEAAGAESPKAVVQTQAELTASYGKSPRALAERAWASGAAESETRFLVVGQERRRLHITEVPLPERGGMVGHALDVTREGETEEQLRRHTAAHDAVLEQLGSGIAVFGPDSRLRFFNGAYAQMWGLDEDWLRTEPGYAELLEVLREQRRLQEQADFARWKRERLNLFTSLIEPREDLMHLPDGRTVRDLAVPHPLGGIMFVQEDVTNALALESSYNTLMAVQQETLDNLAEGVALFGGDGRLKLSNPAYARIWKLRPEELASEPHLAQVVEMSRSLLDSDGDWEAHKGRLINLALSRHPKGDRVEFTDGRFVSWQSVPLPDGAVLISVMDVTDSVHVEQALRATNEALATADRLKGEFVANVSYQLRTPLNAIMGFAEILNNRYFGPLTDRQQEYVRGVLEAGSRLLTLINDILDLASIEAGFMTLEVAPVEVSGLLRTVADLTQDWTRQRQLEVKVECGPGVGIIQGDEKRLKQALFNVLSNAIKFTLPGGVIGMAARRAGDRIELVVSDTGIGIPAADRDRVFGRFERGQDPSANLGAGLGLSLVKSIVELHGGTVTLDSEPGRGTQVRLQIPIGERIARLAGDDDGAELRRRHALGG